MDKRVYILDGAKFSSLEGFARHFSEVVLEDYQWSGNLDALNDILWGGFGTPEGGFVLRWQNSELSRRNLGTAETVRRLEAHLLICDPSGAPQMQRRLAEAKQGRGETLFDTIVEIIRDHGDGGRQSRSGVELQLL